MAEFITSVDIFSFLPAGHTLRTWLAGPNITLRSPRLCISLCIPTLLCVQ